MFYTCTVCDLIYIKQGFKNRKLSTCSQNKCAECPDCLNSTVNHAALDYVKWIIKWGVIIEYSKLLMHVISGIYDRLSTQVCI
jgi:hypothetical protein